ncbi:hypothetical protein [Actinomarinicola tropica]|uniref:Uncharacterized protein n=1 Tax=Actinomarinicola tropica TaxID=2789776 RepID=A0A5Q2RK48_9ACTN|nr:hypothetical protein [Actinomarinicola tropica]QGG94427.1 hypothetical protein GH723_04520 [Actinomarinicola tropica]
MSDLADIADQVIDIGLSDNRTADEQIVWDAAGPNIVDVGVGAAGAVDGAKGTPKVPGAGPVGVANEAVKYGTAGAKAVDTFTRAVNSRTSAADAAYSHKPGRESSSSSDSDSGSDE